MGRPTYADRFQHLLQRIEARVNDTDSGEFTSKLFAADGVSAEEAAAADLLTHDDILADPAPHSKARTGLPADRRT